jgi:hypothetical protein
MKIVKVNKSQLNGKRGNSQTLDYRQKESKMMVDLSEVDMMNLFNVRDISETSVDGIFRGNDEIKSVEELEVETKITDYLNQKLHNQISYKYDGTLEERNQIDDEIEKEDGITLDRNRPLERRFNDSELVVYRIKRHDRYNDLIDMKEHLGIDVEEVK